MLGDLDIAVAHLIAEQVRGRVFLRHKCSVGMPQIVVFEVDTKAAFEFPRGVFHGIHGLYFPIRQAVDQIQRGNLLAIQVLYTIMMRFSGLLKTELPAESAQTASYPARPARVRRRLHFCGGLWAVPNSRPLRIRSPMCLLTPTIINSNFAPCFSVKISL